MVKDFTCEPGEGIKVKLWRSTQEKYWKQAMLNKLWKDRDIENDGCNCNGERSGGKKRAK